MVCSCFSIFSSISAPYSCRSRPSASRKDCLEGMVRGGMRSGGSPDVSHPYHQLYDVPGVELHAHHVGYHLLQTKVVARQVKFQDVVVGREALASRLLDGLEVLRRRSSGACVGGREGYLETQGGHFCQVLVQPVLVLRHSVGTHVVEPAVGATEVGHG